MSERAEMEAVLEAVLFVATDPIPRAKLLEVLDQRRKALAEEALEAVLERYREAPERGVQVEEVAGGVRLVTRPELHGYLRKFFEVTGRSRLSMAALETLAIVAYRQPVTGPEIQELRGVNTSGVLKTLLDRRLIRIAGRREVVGQPFLYRTTREFLMHFGLKSLDDLPPLEEFEETFGSLQESLDLGRPPEEEEGMPESDGEAAPDGAPADEVEDRAEAPPAADEARPRPVEVEGR